MIVIILAFIFVSVVLFVLIGIRIFNRKYAAYEERYLAKAAGTLDEMFVFLPAEQVLYLNFVSIAVMAVIGFVMTMGAPLPVPVIMPLLFGLGGFFIPRIVLGIMLRKRLDKFEHQLVDGLATVSNALKAGFSFMQAVDRLAKEMPPPISQEFALVIRENKLGVTLEDALTNLTKRVNSEDLDLVVTSVIVTRQVGGNLAEIFDRIAETIRERFKLQGKIKTLTAQGKLQGIVVGLLPVFLGLVLYKIDPQMMRPMFTTLPGWIGLGIILVLEIAGAFLIKKIVTIDV